MSATGAVDAERNGRRSRQQEWRPILLHQPTSFVGARTLWQPVILRKRRVETVTVLIAFLALQFLIPARLVIGGLGAIGRPAVAVGIMLAFLWLVSLIRSQLPTGSQPIRWVIGSYVLVQLVGYVVGFDRGLPSAEASSADRWMIYTVAMVGVSLAVADGIATRRQLDRLLLWLVGLSSVMAFVGALQFFRVIDVVQYIRIPGLQANAALIGVGERGGPGFARVASTAGHYIEFGVVLALVLPIAMHYALFSPPSRRRTLLWVAVGLIASGIPFSISRSATLAVAMIMALAAVVWPWRQRYNALVIAFLATATFHVLQPGVLGTIKALFTNVDNDPSIQGRVSDTAYVMDLWALRPWLGRGAGTVIPEEYILLDNQLYATLLAGGVLGVAGLVFFFLAPYFVGRSIRLRGADQETRHLAHTLAIVLPVGLMVSATFDSFSFATFTSVIFLVVGAVGALWRLEDMSLRKPLQPAAPGDKFVTTPWMTNWRPEPERDARRARPRPSTR